MQNIILVLNVLLMVTVSSVQKNIVGAYSAFVSDRNLHYNLILTFYENNSYEISKSKMYDEHDICISDEITISHGKFVLKGDTVIILTETVTGTKIQLRHFKEVDKTKTLTFRNEISVLEIEQGNKLLNGKKLYCSMSSDIFTTIAEKKSFWGVYSYEIDENRTCFISFYVRGCYEIEIIDYTFDEMPSKTVLSSGTFVLKGDTIILTPENNDAKIQLRRFNNKIKVEEGFSYFKDKVFGYWGKSNVSFGGYCDPDLR